MIIILLTLNKSKTYLKNLLVISAGFEQVKNSFQRNSVTGRHATPLATLFFGVTMLFTGCHAMLVVFERVFLLSGVFYLTLLPAVFKVSLGASSSTSKLAGLHADLQNIAPARLFVWIKIIRKRSMVVGPI